MREIPCQWERMEFTTWDLGTVKPSTKNSPTGHRIAVYAFFIARESGGVIAKILPRRHWTASAVMLGRGSRPLTVASDLHHADSLENGLLPNHIARIVEKICRPASRTDSHSRRCPRAPPMCSDSARGVERKINLSNPFGGTFSHSMLDPGHAVDSCRAAVGQSVSVSLRRALPPCRRSPAPRRNVRGVLRFRRPPSTRMFLAGSAGFRPSRRQAALTRRKLPGSFCLRMTMRLE